MASFRKRQPVWWERGIWLAENGARLNTAGIIISVNNTTDEALVEFPQASESIQMIVSMNELRERSYPV